MYLAGYTAMSAPTSGDASGRRQQQQQQQQLVQGAFSVLGAMRKGVRESYEVKLYKPLANEKGSFWCSCADMKFNGSKRGTVCKHICFVVCKVGKILCPDYFASKQLTREQFDALVAKLDAESALWHDSQLFRTAPPEAVTLASFKGRTREIGPDDVCPICYDEFGDPDSTVSCPACANYVHTDCVSVWCERKTTCVMCRADVWGRFAALMAR
jgi:predicted nucleic acid-binding Zn finger protein